MNPINRSVLRAGLTLALCSTSHLAAAASDNGSQSASTGTSNQSAQASATNGTFVHASKPYVLFMGADVSVKNDTIFSPVQEVTRSVAVVKADNKLVNVPLDRKVSLQFRDDLKVTEKSVEISSLKTDRVYSPSADPFKGFANGENLVQGAEAVADASQAIANSTAAESISLPAAPGAPVAVVANSADVMAAQSTADSDRFEATRESGMVSSFAGKQAAAEGQQMFDAIRISFAVTPRSDLAKPYIAIIAQIRDPSLKSDHTEPWIHLQPLGPLSAGVATKVTVYQEGMPPGYDLVKCDVHFYDGADELATNLSNKRVPLSKDEMLDFRVIEYLSANRGRTLPAVPATFVRDMRSSLTPAELNQACYVRVAKNGKVAATFADKAGTQPLQDETLDSALRGIRFKPAIEAGRPVETIVPIRLGMIASL